MAIWDFVIKVNSVDLQTLNFSPATLDGPWDSPDATFDEVQLPEKIGTSRTTRTPRTDALDLNITGEINAATESAFETDCLNIKGTVKSGSDATVLVGNQDTFQRTGYIKGPVKIRPKMATADGLTEAVCSFTIHCEDPRAFATTPTTVTGAQATDLACALGTADSDPVITITSPTAPFTITYKSYAGATVATLTLGTGSGTTWVIDMGARTITVDGVRHDEYLTAGNFFVLSAGDGVYSLGHFPTVRSSSATGGSGVSIVYPKAY